MHLQKMMRFNPADLEAAGSSSISSDHRWPVLWDRIIRYWAVERVKAWGLYQASKGRKKCRKRNGRRFTPIQAW